MLYEVITPYYLRLHLQDKPGALAKVATVLGEAGVSISRMRQYGHADTTRITSYNVCYTKLLRSSTTAKRFRS